MTRYDETKPQIWTRAAARRDRARPVGDRAEGRLHRAGRACGDGRGQAEAARHRLPHARQGERKADVETFRADKATFGAGSLESHQRLTLEGGWKPEARALAKGTLFVPIAQPKARLVMAMFEPQAPDSMLAWGAFNNAFERKEYMEEYVAEDVARELMAADPALAAPFQGQARDRPGVRQKARRAPGVLRAPPLVVGRALQPVSGACARTSAP